MAQPTSKPTLNPSSPTTSSSYVNPTQYAEEAVFHEGETICWKSVFAGLFVSILSYSALMALGLAFGGANLQGAIQGPDTFAGLGIGVVAWWIASLVISLAIGSYAAGRARAVESMEMGRLQGLVVAGIFFMFTLAQFGTVISALGRGAGATLGAAGSVAGQAITDPRVADFAEDLIGRSNLRSSPEVVAEGVARRVIRGDTESATSYLAYQTNTTTAEAQARIQRLQQNVNQAATDAGIATARALKFAGWTLFASIILGAFAAAAAGGMGGSIARRMGFEPTIRTRRGTA
jgi:hypothetical protein